MLTRSSWHASHSILYPPFGFGASIASQTVASNLGPEWHAGSIRLLFRGREMKANNATLEVKRERRGEGSLPQLVVAAVGRRARYTLKRVSRAAGCSCLERTGEALQNPLLRRACLPAPLAPPANPRDRPVSCRRFVTFFSFPSLLLFALVIITIPLSPRPRPRAHAHVRGLSWCLIAAFAFTGARRVRRDLDARGEAPDSSDRPTGRQHAGCWTCHSRQERGGVVPSNDVLNQSNG